ncbi:MAG: TolC family protein [Bryobacteraceae bacterium]
MIPDPWKTRLLGRLPGVEARRQPWRTAGLRLIPLLLLPAAVLVAQPYTLRRAVEEAASRYPTVAVSAERLEAATAAVRLARTAWLPRADLTAQVNRATRNNVFGMLLPPAGVPSISGPPLASNDMTSVWGSATGLQISWEPFDFGLRRASLNSAEAARRRSAAAAERARLEAAFAAADAFLIVLAARQTEAAAQAGVERAKALKSVVDALVQAQLRPGADASRAAAELASAMNQRIQAAQAVEAARASLAQYVSEDGSLPDVDPGPFLRSVPEASAPEAASGDHPQLAEQRAAVEQSAAALDAAAKSWRPKFAVTAAAYARGTGAMPDGTTLSGFSGLGPNIFNWGVGLALNFPLSELPAWKARKDAALHEERAEKARQLQIQRELHTAVVRARAALDAARRIAENTPVQLKAARDAEAQSMARYRAGLATLAEAAEAQRMLVLAEIDDSLARLNVWRALLHVCAAAGDLEPFLREAGR